MLNKKWIRAILAALAAAALAGSGYWLGWSSGVEHPKHVIVSGVTNIGGAASGSTYTAAPADFGVFWQAWSDIENLYLRNPSTTAQQKIRGAMSGLVQSLGDPYTEYFPPALNQQFQEDIAGHFGGIGAQLGMNAKSRLVVIAPLPNTPAAKAGLKANDQILQINATSTDGMSVDAAVNVIRGPIGTAVTLTVFRNGWTKPQDFKITRAEINVPTVDFKMKGDIAVISLHEFTQDANFLFYKALTQAVGANARGIVLDLRDDPGGYLEVAVDIAGYFVKPGTPVVKEVGRSVPEEDYTASGDGSLADMPLAVLVNGGSASASEILAGALRDDRTGAADSPSAGPAVKLVGEQSFGKGTVQQLEQLVDGSSVKITVAHWVLPSGKIIDHEGLTPDYIVKISDADAAAGKDPQMNKALEVVREEIGK